MSLKGLARFNAASSGIKNSVRNLASVSRAKRAQEQKDKLFDIQTKTAELKLKELEASGQTSSLENKIMGEILNSMNKQKKDVMKGNQSMIEMTEMQERQKLSSYGNIMKQSAQDPDVQDHIINQSSAMSRINPNLPRNTGAPDSDIFSTLDTMGLKITGNISKPNIGFKDQGGKQKILGDIQNGGYYSGEDFVEFQDRKEAERYLNSKLGTNALKNNPQANQLITRRFGPDVKSFPKSIKTMREGYDYLVKKVGMTPESAKKWLEDNN